MTIKLYKDGITVEAEHPTDIAFYKRAGYVVVEDPKPAKQAEKPAEKPDKKPAEK